MFRVGVLLLVISAFQCITAFTSAGGIQVILVCFAEDYIFLEVACWIHAVHPCFYRCSRDKGAARMICLALLCRLRVELARR